MFYCISSCYPSSSYIDWHTKKVNWLLDLQSEKKRKKSCIINEVTYVCIAVAYRLWDNNDDDDG